MHPAPWVPAQGGLSYDIYAQIVVPTTAAQTVDERMDLAATAAFLMRIGCDPAISMVAIANAAFSDFVKPSVSENVVIPLEHRARTIPLVQKGSNPDHDMPWILKYFAITHRMKLESAEFRLAVDALDRGQYINNTALTLISLWGALEAIFSPGRGELRFRVASLIAAYLHKAGSERLAAQKRIVAIYDKRSAAAHGKPKHTVEHLVGTFELLREVVLKIIKEGEIPDRHALEARLFGAT